MYPFVEKIRPFSWQSASNQLTLQHQKQAGMATGFTYRHYILKDHLGSWTTITDAEGNVEQELSFDAWVKNRV